MSENPEEACEVPTHPNDPELVKKIVTQYKTIAIVGISKKIERDSHMVAAYLKGNGYQIIPVNPTADTILGEKCYNRLSEIPFSVDVIDVFRKPSALVDLADEIIGLENTPKSVWFQIGVINNTASKKIEKAGIEIVQNRCIKVEHIRINT